MVISPEELKKIKKICINSFFLCLLLVGTIWLVQYFRIKQKNPEVRIDKSGRIVIKNDKILPIDIEAHRLIAERYLESGQAEKALLHLQRILSFESNDRLLRYQFASALLEAGYYDKALDEFLVLEHAPVSDSLSPKICSRKGITLFYLKKNTESRGFLDSCLSQFPKSAEAACFLGQIEAAKQANSPRALAFFEQALRLDSLYVEGWYQLARFKMQSGDYIEARKLLLRALEIDPLHIKSHSRLGMVYYYLGDYEVARKSYQTALALNPKDFNTHYNLGELYYSAMHDTESALREYTAALQVNPAHVESNFKVGLICLRNNMIKEAIRYFTTALSAEPDNVRILLQLAVAYEKLGDRERALRIYQSIKAVEPLNSIAIQKIKYLSEH